MTQVTRADDHPAQPPSGKWAGRGSGSRPRSSPAPSPRPSRLLPAELAEVLADADLGLSRGELSSGSHDLRRLIGRPTTPLANAIADALP
jgi:hypothetical protein